jgi:hypothetical protein
VIENLEVMLRRPIVGKNKSENVLGQGKWPAERLPGLVDALRVVAALPSHCVPSDFALCYNCAP